MEEPEAADSLAVDFPAEVSAEEGAAAGSSCGEFNIKAVQSRNNDCFVTAFLFI